MPEGEGTTEGTSQTAGEAGKSTQGGTTGTGAATQNAGTERTFTQAEVEQIVKGRLTAEQERQRKKGEEEDAKKRGDYETLARQERERTEAALTRLKARAVQAEVATHAGKLNLVDTETALALIQGKVEYDNDGEPTNVEKLLTELVKAKPFLVKSEPGGSTTSTANPGGGGAGTKFDPKRPPTWGQAFSKR